MLLVGNGAGAASDWIVVSVVASDCTDGAGLEKVLSLPRLNSVPPPVVRAVPVTELAPWLGAVSDTGLSSSVVEKVPAMLRPPPPLGGGSGMPMSSFEYLVDWPIDRKPVCCVPNEVTLCVCWPWLALTVPDSG